MKYRLYLDDMRTPVNTIWLVVRNFNEFVDTIQKFGVDNFSVISLDHDLADEHYRPSMYHPDEHYSNYYSDGTFKEKTGYDCAKFLVDYCLDNVLSLPQVYTHSYNPIGGENIIRLINNFYETTKSNLKCVRVNIEHYIKYDSIF